MENTSMSEFSQVEVDILSKLTPDDEREPAQNEPKEQVQEAQAPTTPETPEAATTTAAAEPAKDAPQGGDPRAALRAARAGERRALAHAKELEEKLAKLQTAQPATPAGEPEDPLAAIEQDFPQLKVLTAEVRELREKTRTAEPEPKSEPVEEFIPQKFNDSMQDMIDSVPQLQAWQFDPAGQANFQAAVKLDAYLAALPQWKDKPTAERLAEVTRRVALEASQAAPVAPATTNRRNPADVIAGLKPEGPKGISDLRGGAAPGQLSPNYKQMTDEDIMASLPSD